MSSFHAVIVFVVIGVSACSRKDVNVAHISPVQPVVLTNLKQLSVCLGDSRIQVDQLTDSLSVEHASDLSTRAHYVRLMCAARSNTNTPGDGEQLQLCRKLLLSNSSDFERIGNSIRYRISKSRRDIGEWHPGQVLSVLAECGGPLTDSLPADLQCTVADLVTESASSFSFDEEIEWRAVALALYRPQVTPWKTATGETVAFDDITQELLSRTRTRGSARSCWGTHPRYALSVFLKVNRSTAIWGNRLLRSTTERSLGNAAETLARSRHTDGSLDEKWDLTQASHPAMSDKHRLLVTGHHLEWVAMTPEDLRPSPFVIQRAAEFIVNQVESYSPDDVV